jgi:alpha-amylase/alpha-mannosidase (GH57 family)
MQGRILKAFCIHGHFYQPPREDPLTGQVPQEAGAAPFHDWNERILDQCYRPNASLGNFQKISFDLGPTLAVWMEEHDSTSLAKIIEQDRANFDKYGFGNAMAQSYNHTILPLATRQDKITQVLWGISSFETYYGHRPQGMWLPETAVDLETLEVLAECGILFTILAPWQADTENLDTSQAYWVELPNKNKIAVFFYQQSLSTRISFDPGTTSNADSFIVQHLLPAFSSKTETPDQGKLVLIASDGEVYGHHQPFRDKFLSYLLDGALKSQPVSYTFLALWLAENPPQKTIKIHQNTSWSCHHGVMRWYGVCDCTPNSEWKAPLRKAFNTIARLLDEQYTSVLKEYLIDPWLMRHRYCDVFCGNMNEDEYINSMLGRQLPELELQRIKLLLQAQVERQKMFTSCGWFFDDFDRIEPRNNVAYAAQAVWLTYLATGMDFSSKAREYLKNVRSWRTGMSADVVFNQFLDRARILTGISQRKIVQAKGL